MSEKRTGKRITYKGVTKLCEFYKGKPWDKPLTKKMEEFEKETNKKAIYNGAVTGGFEYWLYWKGETITRKRRTKKEIGRDIAKKRKHIKQEYVNISERELKSIMNRNKNKIPQIGIRQINRLLKKLKNCTDENFIQVYRKEILKIFDMYNIKYNKNKIVYI